MKQPRYLYRCLTCDDHFAANTYDEVSGAASAHHRATRSRAMYRTGLGGHHTFVGRREKVERKFAEVSAIYGRLPKLRKAVAHHFEVVR